ncbi:hypothetical protein BGW41_000268 [Actinomortierella wolfii]|nr:hypothetical protein BGW41_000268 [Actinomortierella wolfii]
MRTAAVRWITTLSVALVLSSHSGTLLSSHSSNNGNSHLAFALPVDPVPINKKPPHSSPPSTPHDTTTTNTDRYHSYEGLEVVETKPTDMFNIIYPAPDEVWVTGTMEAVFWGYDTEPPEGTTFDVSIIPVTTAEDAKTWSRLPVNPQAMYKTVRPIRRFVDPEIHNFEFAVPYDLVPRPILEQHRQLALKRQAEELEQRQKQGLNLEHGDNAGAGTQQAPNQDEEDKQGKGNKESSTPTTPATPVRVVVTAYEGRTKKKIAESSVYPVMVQLEEFSSLERVDMIKRVKDERENGRPMPIHSQDEDESHSKEDSTLNQSEDGEQLEQQNEVGDDNAEDEPDHEGDDNEKEEPATGDTNIEEPEVGDDPLDLGDVYSHGHNHGDEEDGPEGEVVEEGGDHDHDHDHDHEHDHGDEDPSMFEKYVPTEEDQPPVLHAGTLEVTRWNEYKVRFFTGAPYIIGWDWSKTLLHPEDRDMEWDPELKMKVAVQRKRAPQPPPSVSTTPQDATGNNDNIPDNNGNDLEDGHGHDEHEHEHKSLKILKEQSLPQTWALEDLEDLEGKTNIYIEDIMTGQRYSVVAMDLPSNIRAVYFTPTPQMIGPNATPLPAGVEPGPNFILPKDPGRIMLHARIEMNLYKDDVILRFTGFSRPFFVEQGAL